MKYIRKENLLYIREGELFLLAKEFDSISKAKNHTRDLEKKEPGSVRRYETLVARFGKQEADAVIHNRPSILKPMILGPRDEALGQEILDATKTES